MKPLSFEDIKADYELAKKLGHSSGSLSLQDFAAEQQQLQPSLDWSQGTLPDNLVTKYSRGVDSLLDATGLPEKSGDLIGGAGAGLDYLIGNKEQRFENVGRGVGEELPRGLAQIGSFMGGAALTATGGGAVVGVPLMGAAVGDATAKGYSDTGSKTMGAVQGLTTAFAPGIGSAGTKLGMKMLPKALAGSAPARFVASELGQEAAFGGAQLAGDLVGGRGFQDTFSAENLFATAAGNLAFQPISMRNSIKEARQGAKNFAEEQVRPDVDTAESDEPFGFLEYKRGLGVDAEKFFDFATNPSRKDDLKIKKSLIAFEKKNNPDFNEEASIRELLQMAGVNDDSILPPTYKSLGRLTKAGRLVEKMAMSDAEHGELIQRTAKLLQEPVDNVVSLINLVKANNEMGALPNVIEIPSASQRGKIQKKLQRQRDIEQDRLDEQAALKIEQHRAEVEGEQARLRSKYNMDEPNFSDPEVQARYYAENSELRPRVGSQETEVLGINQRVESNSAKRKVKAAQQAEESNRFRKGKIRPNALENRMLRPKYKKVESFDAADSDVFRFTKGNVIEQGGKITRLGNSDVARDGTMNATRFTKTTQMPKEVFELVKQVYPEAFNNDTVNVHRLRELEKERPMFETHVYGQDGTGKDKARYDEVRGELDIRGIYFDDATGWILNSNGDHITIDHPSITPEIRPLLQEALDLGRAQFEGRSSEPVATSYYNQISPFDTKKYPVVRIDVTVPLEGSPAMTYDKFRKNVRGADNETVREAYRNSPVSNRVKRTLWQQDDLHENLPNTAGWAMVQFVPDPKTGETVMFLGEQQSRWGQTNKKIKASKSAQDNQQRYGLKEHAPDHPLLEHQHKLIIKAAMDEARKRGVNKMVISDGETAMMTERHDSDANVYVETPPQLIGKTLELDSAGKDMSEFEALAPFKVLSGGADIRSVRVEGNTGMTYIMPRSIFKLTKDQQHLFDTQQLKTAEPSQASGMRQHYDELLQSAAAKMTGSKGEKVDMGDHKNAINPNLIAYKADNGFWTVDTEGPSKYFDSEIQAQAYADSNQGSPVFRNETGARKTSATGTMYDISPEVVDNARYKKLTAEQLKQDYSRILKEEDGDEQRTVGRLGNKLKGMLQVNVERAKPGFVQSAMNFVRESMLIKGLEPELVEAYVQATERILTRLDVNNKSTVSDIADPKYRSKVRDTFDDAKFREFNEGKVVGFALRNNKNDQVDIGVRSNMNPEETLISIIHEAIHGVQVRAEESMYKGVDSFRSKNFQEALAFAKSVDVNTRADILNKFYKDLGLKESFAKGSAEYAAKTDLEFVVEFAAVAAMRNDLKDLRPTLRFLPEPIRKFVQDTLRAVKELAESVSLALSFNAYKPSDIQSLNKFIRNIDGLVKPDPEVTKAKDKAMGVAKARNTLETNPSLNEFLFKKVEKNVDEFVGSKTQQDPKAVGFFGRNLATLQQQANSMKWREAIPAFGRSIGILTTMSGKSREYNQLINKDWMLDIGGGILRDMRQLKDSKLTPAALAKKNQFLRVKESPKLTRLLSEMQLESNKIVELVSKTQEAYPDVNHPMIKRLYEKFSPEDQAAVKTIYEADLKRNQRVAELEIDARFKSHAIDMATIFLSSGVRHSQAREMGLQLIQKLHRNGVLTPEELAQPGMQKAFNYWEKISGDFNEFINSRDRPYFSEMRTGQYLIKFETDELDEDNRRMTDTRSAATVQEANAIIKELKEKDFNIIQHNGKDYMDRNKKEFNEFDVLPTYLIERARNLEAARYDAMVKAVGGELAEKMRSVYVGGEALAEQAANRKGSSNTRRFKSARENINMLNNQEAYINIMSSKISRQVQRAEFNWQMRHEDWQKDSRLQNEVQEFGHNVLNAQIGNIQFMKNAVIVSAMGFNVSSAIIDSSQAITMGVHKAAEFIPYHKAYGYVGQGYMEAFRPTVKDKEFAAILAKADTQGLLITGSRMDEFVSMEDLSGFNLGRQSDGADLVTQKDALTSQEFMAGKVMDMFKKFAHFGTKAAMMPTSISAQVNNKTMLYVGYRTGKDLGYKGQELYDFARNMMQVTNVQGGLAAQSSFKLKAGKLNDFISLGTVLTNYPIAAYSQMVTSYQSMLKSSGLSEADRKKAMQVFTGQVLTQFAFAGTLGFGLDALFEISEQWFGVDTESEVRKSLAAIDESGMLGDIVLNGVMDQVTQTDLSSRYSLSGIGGFNGYTGFDAKGIFGATGSFWSNMYKLPSDIKDDVDLSKIGILPNGVKKMLGATEDSFTDRNSQTIIDPTEVDRMKYFLGFRPKRLSDAQSQRDAMRSAVEIETREKKKRTKQMMQMIEEGNPQAAMEMAQAEIAERLSEMKANGVSERELSKEADKMLRQRMLSLVDSIVEKDTPIDPLSEGSSDAMERQQSIAQSYGNRLVPRSSKTKMLERKSNLLESIGLKPKRGQPRAIQIARMIDQVLMENPTMTEQEARQIVMQNM